MLRNSSNGQQMCRCDAFTLTRAERESEMLIALMRVSKRPTRVAVQRAIQLGPLSPQVPHWHSLEICHP